MLPSSSVKIKEKGNRATVEVLAGPGLFFCSIRGGRPLDPATAENSGFSGVIGELH